MAIYAPNLDWPTFKAKVLSDYRANGYIKHASKRATWTKALGLDLGGKYSVEVSGVKGLGDFMQGRPTGNNDDMGFPVYERNPNALQDFQAAIDKAAANQGTVYTINCDRVMPGGKTAGGLVRSQLKYKRSGNRMYCIDQRDFTKEGETKRFLQGAALFATAVAAGTALESALAESGGATVSDTASANYFDSYGYSSGESVPAYSDAGNVSYGFNDPVTSGADGVVGGIDAAPDVALTDSVTVNGTGESIVSDYGSVQYPTQPSSGAIDYASGDSIRAARVQAGTWDGIPSITGAPSGGGLATLEGAVEVAGKVAGGVKAAVGTAVAVKSLGAAVRAPTRGASSTANQRETARPVTAVGQLGSEGGGRASGAAGLVLALLGVAIGGYALLKS